MIGAISQVCVLGSSFESDLVEFKAAGFNCAECWITKLDTYILRHSLDSVTRLLAEHQIRLPVASFQGGILSSDGTGTCAAWQLLQKRLALLPRIGCQTLVVAADVPHPLDPAAVDSALKNLAAAAALAEGTGVRLALEFQAGSAFITNLQTAAAVIEQIASPSLGICLDTFHFHVGPSKFQDLDLLTDRNLFHVQLADVADRPREFASDADRILPADGEILWHPIMQRLRDISYRGLLSVEVMNSRFAQIPARQFADVARQALDGIGLSDASSPAKGHPRSGPLSLAQDSGYEQEHWRD